MRQIGNSSICSEYSKHRIVPIVKIDKDSVIIAKNNDLKIAVKYQDKTCDNTALR